MNRTHSELKKGSKLDCFAFFISASNIQCYLIGIFESLDIETGR